MVLLTTTAMLHLKEYLAWQICR